MDRRCGWSVTFRGFGRFQGPSVGDVSRTCTSAGLGWVLLLLLAAVSLGQSQAQAQPPVAKSVIVVVIDGARYSETFGDSQHRYLPHIWNELRPQGTIHTSFYNRGQTVTLGAHATMLTGNRTWMVWPSDPEREVYRPFSPTLFEYLRASSPLGAAETDAWMLADHRPELQGMTYSASPSYGSSYGASWHFSASFSDGYLAQDVLSVLQEYHPRLVLVNLHETDTWAHKGNASQYVAAITRADQYIHDLWEWICQDSVYAGTTTLIVTSDHGRHTWNYREHGDCCDGCQHVLFLALGAGIKQGYVAKSPERHLEDIAVTVGSLMGLDTPEAIDGALMTELLAPGVEAQAPQNAYLDSLDLSAQFADAQGAAKSTFRLGEPVYLRLLVGNGGRSDADLYQSEWAMLRCQRAESYVASPIPLPADGGPVDLGLVSAGRALPVGKWVVPVSCKGVDAEGNTVRGTVQLPITIKAK